MFRSTVILSDKKYNEKRSPNSNSLETSINFRKVIGANKTDDLKSFLSENKNIDPKIVEDGLISILKNKQMLLNKDFIEMLLSLNPDLNRTDNEKKNCLIYAAERGESELVRSFLAHNGNPKFINEYNKNALFYAIDNEETKELYDVINVLVPSSDLNIVTKDGNTALMKAIERQFVHIVELLLSNKADPNIKNSSTWETPLHICLKLKNKQIFMLLIQNKCDFKIRNKKNISSLELIENDKEFKTLLESWMSINPEIGLISSSKDSYQKQNYFEKTILINEEKEPLQNDRKKKKKKSSKTSNKIIDLNPCNLPEILPIKIALEESHTKTTTIKNLFEQISLKTNTENSSSRQSINSKSEENLNESKKNNSKEQSIDSKKSDKLENQLQNCIAEIERNKNEITVLKNTIKLNSDKMKDLESKLDALSKENFELKKINDNLKELVSKATENPSQKCSTDIGKLLAEKNLKIEKKLSLINDDTIDISLNNEIIEFHNTITSINNSNRPLFDKLIENFKIIISEIFPNATIHLYGSYATDLCLPYSDIDLVVELPNPTELRPPRSEIEMKLQKLEECLKKVDFIKEIKNIFTASIPLIKITCNGEYMNKKVDITIQDQNHNGTKCVTLIKDYIKEFPLLKYLVLALKHLLYVCDRSDSYLGGLSSYGLILMIGSFLQMKKLRSINPEDNKGIIGQTMLDFLFFFGKTFNYFNTVINPALTSIYPFLLSNCVWNQTPEGCIIPIEKLRIVDPITEKNDVGRCTFNITSIKSIFYNAYLAIRLNYCMDNGFSQAELKKSGNEVEIKHTCCNLKKMFYLPKMFGY